MRKLPAGGRTCIEIPALALSQRLSEILWQGWQIPKELVNIKEYLEHISERESWKQTFYVSSFSFLTSVSLELINLEWNDVVEHNNTLLHAWSNPHSWHGKIV